MALAVALVVIADMRVNLQRDGAIAGLAGYLGAVALAPLFFISIWLRGEPVPASTLLISFAGLIPLFAQPVFGRRWAAAITSAGLGLWLMAAMIVAGAPA